ncbi:GTPase activating protein [Rhodotorula toruloides]|uniref:GTPase activating protein n=1 Tax=Rhodotorula toruloides TaxID=5286 RepID=A0A511KC39_RHOTO|nr:GTPase activating protein [Rhodotorula toruloides]
MSAIARALTSEDESAIQLHGSPSRGSRLSVQPSAPTYLKPSGAGDAVGADVEELDSSRPTRLGGFLVGTVTPPPRTVSLAPSSVHGSPEQPRSREPSTSSIASSQAGQLFSSSEGNSSRANPQSTNGKLTQTDAYPPSILPHPPQLSSSSSAAFPSTSSTFPSTSSNPSQFSTPQKLATAGSSSQPSPAMPSFPPNRTLANSNSLSVSSSYSNVTSNSSHLPAPNTSPYPPSGASFNSFTDPDGVAALVQQLYARLDEQGVPGDGWSEGKERSRDGIILREDLSTEGLNRSAASKGKHVVLPMSPEEEAKADHVLKRVDRYGFFSQSHPAALGSQHNRLATLSASPFSTIPSLSSKRTPRPPSSGTASAKPSPARSKARTHLNRQSIVSLLPSIDVAPESTARETRRIDKWSAMLSVARRDPGGNAQDWVIASSWWSGRVPGGGGGQSGKYRKLQRRVFKGIPDRWRRAVWGLMMEKMASEVRLRGRGRLPSLDELKREYEQLLDQPYVQDTQIDLDVPRTISGHVLFHTRYGQGQRALFHVLHSFGLRSEERAYACLSRLFDQYRLEHIFAPGFPGLVEAFYVQERLVELLMPAVHTAFTDNFISTSAYATKWYITLFANTVPFSTQLRLWDGFFLEGLDFLIVTAVAIIWHFQHDFTAPSASFESILSVLSSYFFVESDDALLRWIRKTLRLEGLRERMKAWREEWQGFVRDGTSEGRAT